MAELLYFLPFYPQRLDCHLQNRQFKWEVSSISSYSPLNQHDIYYVTKVIFFKVV